MRWRASVLMVQLSIKCKFNGHIHCSITQLRHKNSPLTPGLSVITVSKHYSICYFHLNGISLSVCLCMRVKTSHSVSCQCFRKPNRTRYGDLVHSSKAWSYPYFLAYCWAGLLASAHGCLPLDQGAHPPPTSLLHPTQHMLHGIWSKHRASKAMARG